MDKCNFIHYGSDEGLHRHLSAWTSLYENMSKAYMQLASTMREECIKLDKSCTLDEGDNINRALCDISRLLITNIKRNAEHLDNQWRGYENPRSYWSLLNKLDNKFEVGLELQFNSLLSTRDKQEDIVIKANKRYMKNYDQWSKLDENRNRFWPKSRLSSRLASLKKKMEKSYITYRKAYEKDQIDRAIFRESLGYLEEDWITRENEIIGKWRSATQSLIFKLENSSPLATRRFFDDLIHGVIQFDVPRLVNFSLIERRSDEYYFPSFHEHFESLESDKKNQKPKLTSDSGNESQEDSLYMHRKESPEKMKPKNQRHQKYLVAEDIEKSKSHFSPRLSRRDIHKPDGSRRAASPSSRPLGRCKPTHLNRPKETSRNSLESPAREKSNADAANTEFSVPNTNDALTESPDQCVVLSMQTNKIVEKIKETNTEQGMETSERNVTLIAPKADTDMDLREVVTIEGLPQVISQPAATQPPIICSRGSKIVKAQEGICSKNPVWGESATDVSHLCNGQVEQKTQDFNEQPQHELNAIDKEVVKVKNLNTENNMELSARMKSLRKRVTTKTKKGNFTDGSSDENDVLPLKLKRKKLKKKKKMSCESKDNLHNPAYEVVSFPDNEDITGSSDTISDDEAIDSWPSSTSDDADEFPDNTVQSRGFVVVENTLDVNDIEHELSTKTSGKIIGIYPIAVKPDVPNGKIPLGKDQGLSNTLSMSSNSDKEKPELGSKTPLQDWKNDRSLNNLPKFKEKKQKEEEKLKEENEKSRKPLVTDWGSDTDISYEKEMGTKLLDTLKPDNMENNTKINLFEFAKKFGERKKEKEEKFKEDKEELRKAIVADWNSDNDSPISTEEKVEKRSQGPLKPDTKINLVEFAKKFEERKNEKEEKLNAEKEELRKAVVADWNSDDDSPINTEEKAGKGAQGPLIHKDIKNNSKINLVELAKEFEERKQEKEKKMKAEKEELRKLVVADWNSDDDSPVSTDEKVEKQSQDPLKTDTDKNNTKINLVEFAKKFEERKKVKEEKLKAEKEELRKLVVADWNSDDDSPISTDEKVEKQSQDPLKTDTDKNNTKINLVEFAKKFQERKKEKEEKMKAEKEELRKLVVADWNSDDDSPVSTSEKVEKQSQDPLKTDTDKNNTKINLVELAKKFEERKKEKEEKIKAEKEELRKLIVADWNSDDDSPISTDDRVEKQSQDPLRTDTSKNNTKINLVEFAKKFEERKKEKENKLKVQKEELRKAVVADWNSDDDSPISTEEKLGKRAEDPLTLGKTANNSKINLVELAKKYEEKKREKEERLNAEKEELRKAVVADWGSDDDTELSLEKETGNTFFESSKSGTGQNNHKMNLVELAKQFEQKKKEKEIKLKEEKEELRKAVVADWDSDDTSEPSLERETGLDLLASLKANKADKNQKLNLVELAKQFEEKKKEKEEKIKDLEVVSSWDSDSEIRDANSDLEVVVSSWDSESEKNDAKPDLEVVSSWDSDSEDESQLTEDKKTKIIEQSRTSKGKNLDVVYGEELEKNSWDSDSENSSLAEKEQVQLSEAKETNIGSGEGLEKNSWDSDTEDSCQTDEVHAQSSKGKDLDIDYGEGLEKNSWDSDTEDSCKRDKEQAQPHKLKETNFVYGEILEKNSWDSDTENSCQAGEEPAQLSKENVLDVVHGEGLEKNSWDSDTEKNCQTEKEQAQSPKAKEIDIVYGEGLEKNSWDSDTDKNCQADKEQAQSPKAKEIDIVYGEGLEKNSWDSDTEKSCKTEKEQAQSSKVKETNSVYGGGLEKNSWDSDTEKSCQAEEELAQSPKVEEIHIVYGEGLEKNSWDSDTEKSCQAEEELTQSPKAEEIHIVYGEGLEKNSWDSDTENSCQTEDEQAQSPKAKEIDIVYGEGREKNSWDSDTEKSCQIDEERPQANAIDKLSAKDETEKNSWDSDSDDSCIGSSKTKELLAYKKGAHHICGNQPNQTESRPAYEVCDAIEKQHTHLVTAAVILSHQNVDKVQMNRTMVDHNAAFTPIKNAVGDESSGKASGAREFRNVSLSSEVKVKEIKNKMEATVMLDETDSEYESNTDAIIISTESESCSRDQNYKKVPEPTKKIVNTLFACDSENDKALIVGTKTQFLTEEECKQEEMELDEKIAARNKILDGLLASAALLNVESTGFSGYPAKSNTGSQFDNTEPSVHVTNVETCENQPTEVESKLDKDEGSISFESTEDHSENGKHFIFRKQEFETADRKDSNSCDDFQRHSYPTDSTDGIDSFNHYHQIAKTFEIDDSVEFEENQDGYVKENEDMMFQSIHSPVIEEEEEIMDINPDDVRGSWRKILDVQKKDLFYPELKKESKISLDVMNPVTSLKSKSDKSTDLGEGKSKESKNVASQWEELLKQQKYDRVDKVLPPSKSVAKVKSGEPLASCSNVSRGPISSTDSQGFGVASLLSKGGLTALSSNKKAIALNPLKDEDSQRVKKKKKKNSKKGDASCEIQKKRELPTNSSTQPLYDRHPYKNFGAPGRPLSVYEEQEVYQHQLAEETTSQMPQSRSCNYFDEYGRPLTIEEAAMMEEEMASIQERQINRRKELQVEKSTMEKIRDLPRPTRQLPLRQKAKQGLHEMKVKQEPIIKNKILFRTGEPQPVQLTAPVMSEMSVDNSMLSSIDFGQAGPSQSVYPGQLPPGPSHLPPGSHPRNLQPPKAAKGVQQLDNDNILDEKFTHLMTKRTDPDLKSSKDKFKALVASKTKNEKPKNLELQLCTSLSLDLTEDTNKAILPEMWPLGNTTNRSLDETFGPLSPPSSGRAPLKANWEPPTSSKKIIKQSTLDKTCSPLSPPNFGCAPLKANREPPTTSQKSVKPLILDETFGPLSPTSSGRAPLKANWKPPIITENATEQEKIQTSKYLKSRKATNDSQGPSNSEQFAEPASESQQVIADKQELPVRSNRLQLEPLSPSMPKESKLKSRSSTAKSPDTKQKEAGTPEERVQKKSKHCKESRKQKKKLAPKKKVDEESGNTSDDSYPSLNDPCYDN